MSTLVIQVFLSVFPFKFVTVAYTTIYNEYYRKSTGISWSSGISSQKKKEGKTSQESQIQNCAGRETWSPTIELLLKLEAIFLLSVGAASWHISSNDDVENSSKINWTLIKDPSLQNGHLSIRATLKSPKTWG